jgi:hypothetical protein
MLEILIENVENASLNSLEVFMDAVDRIRQNTLPSDLFRKKIKDFSGGDILIKAISQRPVSNHLISIIRYLLQAKNADQLPLIDINNQDGSGKTAMHHLLDNDDIPEDAKREFFDLMLDLRDRNGNLLIDLSACRWHHGTPLMDAIRIRNVHFVRSMLDLRRENGDYAVDVNEARSSPAHTALDVAYMHLFNDANSRQIENELLNRGATRYIEINPNIAQSYRNLPESHALHPNYDPNRYGKLVPQNPPLVLNAVNEQNHPRQPIIQVQTRNVRPVVLPQDQEVNAILDNTQNTHLTSVTVTVNQSLIRLKTRYPKINSNQIFADIKLEFERFYPQSPKKEIIRTALGRIENYETVRSVCNLTLKQAMALVWTGVHDKNALIEGMTTLSDKDIQLRKETFFNNIYKSQTEYKRDNRTSPACFVGTFNKNVETLDRVHPDVFIALSQMQVREVMVQKAFDLIIQQLKERTIHEQRTILRGWDELTDDNMANLFKIAMKGVVAPKLFEEFSAILTDPGTDIKAIVDGFEDLPIPIVCEKLQRLMRTIALLNPEHEHSRQLKILAKQSFEDGDCSFDQQYEILFNEYLIKLPALIKSKEELNNFLNQNEFPLTQAMKNLFTLRYNLYELERYELSVYPEKINENTSAAKLVETVLADVKEINDNNRHQICTKIYKDIESYKQKLEHRNPVIFNYIANILLVVSIIGWFIKYKATDSCFFSTKTHREEMATEINRNLEQTFSVN